MQRVVPIVTGSELRSSKGDFIEEIVKGSFRFSLLKRLNDWSQVAYRVRYDESEKKASLKLGVLASLNEKVTARCMVGPASQD